MPAYYSYKTQQFECRHCGWKGLGSEASQGEMFDMGFELDCPNCYERIGGSFINYPTIEETLEKGPPEDKLTAALLIKLRENPDLMKDDDA